MGFRRRWPGLSYGRGEDWHYVGEAGEPAFENSWANVSGLPAMAYRIREAGVVDIVGVVDTGSSTTSIFTLPADYRPASVSYSLCRSQIGAEEAASLLTINTNGTVVATYSLLTPRIYIFTSFFLQGPDVA